MSDLAAPPAIGERLWEVERCRGSLDCWTAYVDDEVTPEEHWRGHLRHVQVTRVTPARVWYRDGGRERHTGRADLESIGRSSAHRLWFESDLYAAEPPMPEGWNGLPVPADRVAS